MDLEGFLGYGVLETSFEMLNYRLAVLQEHLVGSTKIRIEQGRVV